MAERCAVAFGRYLRTLRERRGLSLDEVSTLSRTFPDAVAKSYLSRVENGRIPLALPKMIPLSRIYEVQPEVLLQRLELDMELDKVGGPDTEDLAYSELTLRGKDAIDCGRVWDAYGYFRDSAKVALESPLMGRLRDHTEQLLCSYMNFGSAASKLGRATVALHELEYIRSTGGISPRLYPILLERLSRVNCLLSRNDVAREYGELAVAEAEKIHLGEYLGYLYSNRGVIAELDAKFEESIIMHQRAFESFRDADQPHECARTLCNIAHLYFLLRRFTAARRALAAAERLAALHNQERTRAFVRLLLGEIEEIESKPEDAELHWREAATIGKGLKDKIICFRADFYLYRQAVSNGHPMVARSLERRLRHAAAWIPSSVTELEAFKRLSSVHGAPRRRRVANMQQSATLVRNQ